MKTAVAVLIAVVALSGCGGDPENSAAETTAAETTAAESSQASQLQACDREIESTLSTITNQASVALEQDLSEYQNALLDGVLSGEPPDNINGTPPLDNYKAVVAGAKAELAKVREGCSASLPECPNAGKASVDFLIAYLDDSVQRLLDSSEATSAPAPSIPPATCE